MFNFVVYDLSTSQNWSTKIRLAEIQFHIPHVLTMIENQKFTEVGKRIMASFKNSIILTTYLKSKVTEQDKPASSGHPKNKRVFGFESSQY